MKQVFFILITSVVLIVSCTDETDLTTSTPQQECNCGTVQSDRVSDYSVVIISVCTGNSKRFYLSQKEWLDAHVGTELCITNSNGWREAEDTLTREEALEYKRITE